LKRFFTSLLCAVAGYPLGALVGYFLIEWFSTNTHDRSVEAAMTSAFVFGPLGAVMAFVIGFVTYGRRSRAASAEG